MQINLGIIVILINIGIYLAVWIRRRKLGRNQG